MASLAVFLISAKTWLQLEEKHSGEGKGDGRNKDPNIPNNS